MSLSLAMLVSDRKLVQCVCHTMAKDLESLQARALAEPPAEAEEHRAGTAAHLGVGYYDQGEVLLSRRPLTAETALAGALCRFQSTALLAHVTVDPVRSFRPMETQPYRYRDWLWVHSGELRERPGFDRNTLAIPSYIRGNIRSWQPQEVVFHLFLSFLHRTGTLDTLHWDRTETRRALSSALSFVPSLYQGPSGKEPPKHSVIATNGEFLFAVGIGRSLVYRRVDGVDPCGLCTDRRRVSPADVRAVGHPHLRSVVVADLPVGADGAARWTEVPERTILEVDGAMGMEQGPLG